MGSHKLIDNNLTNTVTKNTNLERKKGNLVSLTENENAGSHTLPPLKEFPPRNSKSKFGLSWNAHTQLESTREVFKWFHFAYTTSFKSKENDFMVSSLLLASPLQASTHSI